MGFWDKLKKIGSNIFGTAISEADEAFFEDLEILTPRWEKLLQSANVVPCSDALRPLVRYLIQRYWLQAVADYDLLCRVKFIVIACLLVAGFGGDPVQTAQLFSKEIENDPDNLDAILDGAYNYPAFADIALLSLLQIRSAL